MTFPCNSPEAMALIERMCELQAQVAREVIGSQDANDCFCGEPRVGGTKDAAGLARNFRSDGSAVEWIERAVREAIARPRPPSSDLNRDLGPFVEGMVMGLVDQQRIGNVPAGWKVEPMVPDPTGTFALYFISPSGIRWRIRAEIEEPA